MLQELRNWIQANRQRLADRNIVANLSQPSHEFSKNATSVNFKTPRYEATVELWDSGESDFHFLDWEHVGNGVQVQHYEFVRKDDMLTALDQLLEKLAA